MIFSPFKSVAVLIFVLAAGWTSATSAQFFKKEELAVAVGAEAFSQLDRRGIITYGSQLFIPIYSVNVFNPNLQLVGSTLNWKSEFKEANSIVRLRFNADAANDKPLYYTSEKEDDRVRRETSTEVEAFVEYTPISPLEFTFNFGQEIQTHYGQFMELSARVKLGRYFPNKSGFLLEPGLIGGIGGGNQAYNEYYYGTGAKAGQGYYHYGLSLAAPGVIDHFYPWLKIYRSGTLGDNRTASFVRKNERDFWTALILFAFRIY